MIKTSLLKQYTSLSSLESYSTDSLCYDDTTYALEGNGLFTTIWEAIKKFFSWVKDTIMKFFGLIGETRTSKILMVMKIDLNELEELDFYGLSPMPIVHITGKRITLHHESNILKIMDSAARNIENSLRFTAAQHLLLDKLDEINKELTKELARVSSEEDLKKINEVFPNKLNVDVLMRITKDMFATSEESALSEKHFLENSFIGGTVGYVDQQDNKVVILPDEALKESELETGHDIGFIGSGTAGLLNNLKMIVDKFELLDEKITKLGERYNDEVNLDKVVDELQKRTEEIINVLEGNEDEKSTAASIIRSMNQQYKETVKRLLDPNLLKTISGFPKAVKEFSSFIESAKKKKKTSD